MQTKNDTSKPEDSPQQEAGDGCSGATCSGFLITMRDESQYFIPARPLIEDEIAERIANHEKYAWYPEDTLESHREWVEDDYSERYLTSHDCAVNDKFSDSEWSKYAKHAVKIRDGIPQKPEDMWEDAKVEFIPNK